MARLQKKVITNTEEKKYMVSTMIPATLHKAWRIKLLENDMTSTQFLYDQIKKFVNSGKSTSTPAVNAEESRKEITTPVKEEVIANTSAQAPDEKPTKPAKKKATSAKTAKTSPVPLSAEADERVAQNIAKVAMEAKGAE